MPQRYDDAHSFPNTGSPFNTARFTFFTHCLLDDKDKFWRMIVLKTFILILFACQTIYLSYAQRARYPVAAPYAGWGAYSKKFTDAFSSSYNQAALPDMPAFAAGVYGEQRFLMPGLHMFSLSLALNGRFGGFGLNAWYFGNQDLNESHLGLAYGKKLGDINLGIQFDYRRYMAAGAGSEGAATFEIGAIWRISDRVRTGIHVFNPVGVSLPGRQENSPYAYHAGLGFEASDQVFLCMQVIKEEGRPADIVAGLQYVFAGQFFARIGMAAAASLPFGSAGWKWESLRIEMALSYHAQLGFSPGLALFYQPP